jgi:predicted signal transduction protein with EAL and GGDEF domain
MSGQQLLETSGTLGFENGLSLAMGVAHLGADGQTPEELLAVADRRMYTCKADMKRGAPSIARLGAVINATAPATAAPEPTVDLAGVGSGLIQPLQ